MANDEISKLYDLATKAKKDKLGIWPSFLRKVGKPDFNLVFPGHGHAVDPQADKGRVIFPKLFRRSCTWAVSMKGGLIGNSSFKAFLASQPKPDDCYLRDEFLSDSIHSAQRHRLDEFVAANGTVSELPGDLVFAEATSTLLDSSGKEIKHF